VVSDFPWRLVTVDIDGTLTVGHGWRPIAQAFGGLAVFEESNRRFFAQQIGEDAHLSNLLSIAVGRTVAEVESILGATPKLGGIREGIASLHERGARVQLLTHNPDYVADWYRRTFGFDGFSAVTAQPVVEGRIGPPAGVHADKPGALRELLARERVPARSAVHVGDGRSDAVLFALVGGGVALNSPYPDVRRAADLALTTSDFRDVVEGISRLRPRG
jgi:phosphoserine phosphatase